MPSSGLRHQRRSPSGLLATSVGVLLVFAAIIAFGGSQTPFALLMSALANVFAGVVTILLFWVWKESAFANRGLYRLWPSALAFAALLTWIFFSTTSASSPWHGPGWDLIDATGRASVAPFFTTVELFKLIGLSSLFVAGYLISVKPSRRTMSFRILGGVSVAYTLFSLGLFWVDPDHVLGVKKAMHQYRFTATFLDANTAGALFGVFALLSFSVLLSRRYNLIVAGRVSRPAAVRLARDAVILLLFWIALLSTLSRGALMSTAIGSSAVVGLRFWILRPTIPRIATRRAGWWLIPIPALILPVFLASFAYVATWGGVATSTETGRHEIYKKLLVYGLKRPILGYGLGSFRTLNDFAPQTAILSRGWSFAAGHDVYLQWWIEAGAVGAGLMFLLIAAIIFQTWRRLFIDRDGSTLGVLGASLVLILQNTLDFSLEVYGIAMLWALLLGLGIGAPAAKSKAVEDPAPPRKVERRGLSLTQTQVAL